jgi:hypothetical protein
VDGSTGTGSGRWIWRGLASATAGGLVLGLTPSGAGAATPRYYATSACTTDRPYEVVLNIADFPPNDSFRMILGMYSDDEQFVTDFPVTFHTDAGGEDPQSAGIAGVTFYGDRPHRIGGLFYRDANGDSHWNEGEDVVANLIISIDRPCTGAEGSPK